MEEPSPEAQHQYDMLIQCYLSEQMNITQWLTHLRSDPDFARYAEERGLSEGWA